MLTSLAGSVKPSTAAQRGPQSYTSSICAVQRPVFSTEDLKANELEREKSCDETDTHTLDSLIASVGSLATAQTIQLCFPRENEALSADGLVSGGL